VRSAFAKASAVAKAMADKTADSSRGRRLQAKKIAWKEGIHGSAKKLTQSRTDAKRK
jgi:hypothetical protein